MEYNKVSLMLLLQFIVAVSCTDPRIINGTTATIDNTRHQVSVRAKDNEIIFGTGHICGGSLIAPTVVLSAAHCFYEPTYTNDISIIFLDGTVPNTNPAITVIPMNREVTPVGTVCQVTGWGKTEFGYLSDILLTVDVPIIDKKTCSINYGEETIKDGMICAGYMSGEKDASNGDSGGPLVSNGKLVGIVSFGVNDSSLEGYPGVYTDVRYYVDWIDETIKRSSANFNSLNMCLVFIGLFIFMDKF